MSKVAFITGINGQDGSYLAEILLKKGYSVHGMIRRSSSDGTLDRLKDIEGDIQLYFGDMSDSVSLSNIVLKISPDEIYNLAAQSDVGVSFISPSYTERINSLGTLNLLEIIKKHKPICKFYQASTSEMFGSSGVKIVNEESVFCPVSPYGISKLSAYWFVKYFRNAYGMFTTNGILFNHESPRRGSNFVTKKIIKQACEIIVKKREKIKLGNLNAKRDWGYAEDYVNAMWMMMHHSIPDDFIISTGKSYTIECFCNMVFNKLGIKIEWEGEGINRKAINTLNNKIIIEVDENIYRPLDICHLEGDYSKAKKILGWEPKTDLDQLIDIMVDAEMIRM